MRIIIFFIVIILPNALFAHGDSLRLRVNGALGITGKQFKVKSSTYHPKASYYIGISLEKKQHLSSVFRFGLVKNGIRGDYRDLNLNITSFTASYQIKFVFKDRLELNLGPYVSAILRKEISSSDQSLLSSYNALYKESDYGIELSESLPLGKRFSVIAIQRYGFKDLILYRKQGFWVRNYSAHIGLSYRL